MTPAARTPVDEAQFRDALNNLADRGRRAGCALIASGRTALWVRGLPGQPRLLEVIADGAPIGHVDARELVGGGWTWDEDGVIVRWIQRSDHYAPLFDAAAASAEAVPDWPLPAVHVPLIGATLLAGRGPEDAAVIVALIVAGHLDVEELRAVVLQWLGPYALDELHTLVQEAEWRVMKQRYEDGQDPH